jgi:copper(I)-binding protein
MPRLAIPLFCLIAALALRAGGVAQAQAAPDATASIRIEKAWAPPTAGDAKTAEIYFTVINDGGAPDQLLKAETPVAGQTALHAVTMHGDAVTMRAAPIVPVPATGVVTFRPGAWHVMLMDLAEPLRNKTTFPLVLTFKHAGRVEMTVAVRHDRPGSFWGFQPSKPKSDDWDGKTGKGAGGAKKGGLGGLL